MLDISDLRVPRRARHMNLDDVIRLNAAALGDHGLSPELLAAIERAEQLLQPALQERTALAVERVFHGTLVDPADWPGAVTVLYAATIAGYLWRKLPIEDVKELTMRWDIVTHDRTGDAMEQLQTKALAVRFGLVTA